MGTEEELRAIKRWLIVCASILIAIALSVACVFTYRYLSAPPKPRPLTPMEEAKAFAAESQKFQDNLIHMREQLRADGKEWSIGIAKRRLDLTAERLEAIGKPKAAKTFREKVGRMTADEAIVASTRPFQEVLGNDDWVWEH